MLVKQEYPVQEAILPAVKIARLGLLHPGHRVGEEEGGGGRVEHGGRERMPALDERRFQREHRSDRRGRGRLWRSTRRLIARLGRAGGELEPPAAPEVVKVLPLPLGGVFAGLWLATWPFAPGPGELRLALGAARSRRFVDIV